jgi:predicted acetyltransferase
MDELRLEEPQEGFRDSYCELLREFIEGGEALVPFPLSFPHDDFCAFLARMSAAARGEGIPSGFVPHSTYWLIRGASEVVGVSNVRHKLTDALRHEGGLIGYGVRPSARRRGYATELLRQSLLRAWSFGAEEAWLTCAKTNEPSVRTILRNGGHFVSEEFLPERNEVVQRYRIERPPV